MPVVGLQLQGSGLELQRPLRLARFGEQAGGLTQILQGIPRQALLGVQGGQLLADLGVAGIQLGDRR
jgi:hypothetical protein